MGIVLCLSNLSFLLSLPSLLTSSRCKESASKRKESLTLSFILFWPNASVSPFLLLSLCYLERMQLVGRRKQGAKYSNENISSATCSMDPLDLPFPTPYPVLRTRYSWHSLLFVTNQTHYHNFNKRIDRWLTTHQIQTNSLTSIFM